MLESKFLANHFHGCLIDNARYAIRNSSLGSKVIHRIFFIFPTELYRPSVESGRHHGPLRQAIWSLRPGGALLGIAGEGDQQHQEPQGEGEGQDEARMLGPHI